MQSGIFTGNLHYRQVLELCKAPAPKVAKYLQVTNFAIWLNREEADLSLESVSMNILDHTVNLWRITQSHFCTDTTMHNHAISGLSTLENFSIRDLNFAEVVQQYGTRTNHLPSSLSRPPLPAAACVRNQQQDTNERKHLPQAPVVQQVSFGASQLAEVLP